MGSMKDTHKCKCGHASIEHARVSPRVCIHEKGDGDYCPCDAFFPVKKIVRCKCGHGVGAHSKTSTGGGCRACCCGLGQTAARESNRFPSKATRPIDDTPGPTSMLHDRNAWAIMGEAIGDLVAEKNAAYGDSFARSGRVLRELYPNGISLEQLDDALTIVRILDKLFRIATDKDAFGEDPWKDIVGYGLLSVVRRGARKAGS